MANRTSLIRAYRAGQRSSRTTVDADVASSRWEARNCHHSPEQVCDLEHAWWDGFADYDLDRPPYMIDNMPAATEYQFVGDEWLTRCSTCWSVSPNHGFIHIRHGNGGGHNERCPQAPKEQS